MTAAVQIIFPDRPLGVQNAITTIAQLRALDSSDVNENTEVLVAAQGFYKFDPSSLAADDGSTVIKPTDLTTLQAGRWLIVLLSSAGLVGFSYANTYASGSVGAFLKGGVVNVRAAPFNATGDGTTDDRVAVNAAIATLTAGSTLYFPPGSYRLTAPGLGALQEQALIPIPVGANVYMEPSAWILLDTASGPLSAGLHVITAFTPMGQNILQVNVDGQSLPPGSAVESNDWINFSCGVRAYGIASFGVGAVEVTVVNSRFKNLNYAVQSTGAQRWKVLDSRFSRIKQTGVLWGYADGYSSLHNIVSGCDFDNLGDTASAFFKVSGTTAECAYNILANCTTRDWCLRTSGYAYDVETGDPTKQHHNLFIGLIARHDRADITNGNGLAIMSGCSKSAIIGCVGEGALGSVGDNGIAMTECRSCLIANCIVSKFRGSGIIIDGSQDCHSQNNLMVDCGNNTSATGSLIIGLGGGSINLQATRNCTSKGDTITYTVDTAYLGANARAVSMIIGAGHYPIEDIEISGLTINGCDGGAPVSAFGESGNTIKNLVIRNLTVNGRTDLTNPSGSNNRVLVEAYYADDVVIDGLVARDAKNGFIFNNCTRVTLATVNLFGADTIVGLYDFGTGGTASTGVRVRDVRCSATVTTAIVNAGTSTQWLNDEKVVTRASGTSAAIATGATIAHGLAFTPTFVSVTPISATPTDVSATVGSANITVTYGGGGTSTFFWEARV